MPDVQNTCLIVWDKGAATFRNPLSSRGRSSVGLASPQASGVRISTVIESGLEFHAPQRCERPIRSRGTEVLKLPMIVGRRT